MNVCLISREYPPHFGGGIGTYTRQFAAALSGAGHRAVVVTVSADGREHREQQGGVTVVRLPFLDGNDWSAPHAAIRTPETLAAFRMFHPVSVFAMQVADALPQLVREYGIDVIEAPECGALAWFALNARRCGRGWGHGGADGPPLVTHLHSPTAWIERWNGAAEGGRAGAWLKRMEEESVRWSDGLVCPSGPLARWAEEGWRLGAGAVRVVPYPLGTLEEQAREAAAAGRAVGAGPPRVLFAGRLEPRKGVDTLLAGFVRAVESGADLVLDLAGRDITDPATGRGHGAGWVETLVPAPHRGRVRLLGEVRPEELAGLRRTAAMAVVPSPMDNYPYTLIEAMASGVPVVAARAGGMAELVRDGVDGLLFEPGDAASCAEALRRCAAEGVGRGLGESGAARVLEVCGNGPVVGARISHYERVIAGRSARPAPLSTTGGYNVIGAAGSGDAAAALKGALDAAAREASCRGETPPVFAHGWARLLPAAGANGTAPRVLAFGTPTLEGLADSPRRLGPLVVRSEVLDDPRVRERLGGLALDGAEADPWLAAMLLAALGYGGVVAPWVVTDVAGPPREPAPDASWQQRARAAEAELRRIKASRGWRALRRVYRLLGTLRGRAAEGAERRGAI